MSKLEKLLAKLRSRPKTFTYSEMRTLLLKLGYTERKTGKTSGSRLAFIHTEKKHIIRLHKPHPGNELKRYQIDYLIEELKNEGYLKK
ncbi:MAG: type II toxin-antitoxin system HicA family toxin [Bacteroidetes bacterium]|nr:MAG: type II toxin-antitoxin system HicA family toxin [Bacteroidota bacterium]